MKICCRCKIEKEDNSFSKRNKGKYLKSSCKMCDKIYITNYRNNATKKCSGCKIEKQSDCFYKRKDNKSGLKSQCKDCYNKNINEYRQKLHNRFSRSVWKAKHRNKEWLLTLEEYTNLALNPCYYCNNTLGKSEKNCGLDRMDNSKGYIPGNCVSCCYTCNRIKGDNLSVKETKSAVNAIIKIRYPIIEAEID